MLLNPDHFNAFLEKMGQWVRWRPAVTCPCRSESSGAADINCPVCEGRGYTWLDPITASVALTGQRVQQAWAKFGLWESGDVVVSIPSDSSCYGMGEFDRVLFTDSSEPFSASFVRGSERRILLDMASIDEAYIIENGALVPVIVPSLTDEGFSWDDGEGPAVGQQYSIKGRRRPEYFLYQDFPQDRAHHHGADLPRKVVLRRFDLFGREGVGHG